MTSSPQVPSDYYDRTRSAFLWTYLLTGPFWGVYYILPYIMYRDLGASAWQIAIVFALKPIVSLLSFFWSAVVHKRPDRLRSNIISAGIIGYAPFILFPWVDNAWFYVIASAVYMLMMRGVMPAWMEIIKRNIPATSRQHIFAKSFSLYYMGSMIVPLLAGLLMDVYAQAWRWIFPLSALLSLSAILFQWRIPIRSDDAVGTTSVAQESVRARLWEPCQNVLDLLRKRPDFFRFQIGFMLGGFALMLMQPILPDFFMGVLNLSYVELTAALSSCKGIAFVLVSPIWAKLMDKWNIFKISGWVTLLASLFPLALAAAQWDVVWIYIAYLLYGVMQAGSEMSWNLSGPLFAKEEDSSLFSSVNVLSVGIRGCIAPFLGGALGYLVGVGPVLALAFVLCLTATFQMLSSSKQWAEKTPPLSTSP